MMLVNRCLNWWSLINTLYKTGLFSIHVRRYIYTYIFVESRFVLYSSNSKRWVYIALVGELLCEKYIIYYVLFIYNKLICIETKAIKYMLTILETHLEMNHQIKCAVVISCFCRLLSNIYTKTEIRKFELYEGFVFKNLKF